MQTTESDDDQPTAVRSLKELIDLVSGRNLPFTEGDSFPLLADAPPMPFFAIVGQEEMKLALLLALVNPAIGGVLLIGPRGSAKSTIVRSLVDLLPDVERSACRYGCLPEDVLMRGMDAVCPECAIKFGMGEPLTHTERARLVELPLNARLEDVIGGIDERAQLNDRMRLRPGLLSQADQNVLYIDEVNLLAGDVANSILDAAAAGAYSVRRGPVSANYRSQFTLVGSMNPEEGDLRPQLMDRFGLRAAIRGLDNPSDRLEAYRRSAAYRKHPHAFVAQFAEEIRFAREEISAARALIPSVQIPDPLALQAIQLVQAHGIDSLRAEISLFEAAKAHAAISDRDQVRPEDLRAVAPLALRLRASGFMLQYVHHQETEETALRHLLDQFIPQTS